MSRLSDEVLARRAAAGQLDCFEELLVRYRDRVYRICYRSAGNAEDAEDWAQECLLRVYRQLHRYDPAQPFAPWLLRVVSNSCINLAKARGRRPERLELELAEEPGTGDADGELSLAPDPLEIVLSEETAQAAQAAVEALPPLLREAIVLRVVEELSLRELAEVLGIPLQTAATRVRRALAEVRRRLARSEMEAGP